MMIDVMLYYMTTQIADMILRVWPHSLASREVGFVQLVTLVLACAPLLPHLDEKTKAHLKVFRRIVECIKSPHARVSKESQKMPGPAAMLCYALVLIPIPFFLFY